MCTHTFLCLLHLKRSCHYLEPRTQSPWWVHLSLAGKMDSNVWKYPSTKWGKTQQNVNTGRLAMDCATDCRVLLTKESREELKVNKIFIVKCKCWGAVCWVCVYCTTCSMSCGVNPRMTSSTPADDIVHTRRWHHSHQQNNIIHTPHDILLAGMDQRQVLDDID